MDIVIYIVNIQNSFIQCVPQWFCIFNWSFEAVPVDWSQNHFSLMKLTRGKLWYISKIFSVNLWFLFVQVRKTCVFHLNMGLKNEPNGRSAKNSLDRLPFAGMFVKPHWAYSVQSRLLGPWGKSVAILQNIRVKILCNEDWLALLRGIPRVAVMFPGARPFCSVTVWPCVQMSYLARYLIKFLMDLQGNWWT